jgi:hypothetical protein
MAGVSIPLAWENLHLVISPASEIQPLFLRVFNFYVRSYLNHINYPCQGNGARFVALVVGDWTAGPVQLPAGVRKDGPRPIPLVSIGAAPNIGGEIITDRTYAV